MKLANRKKNGEEPMNDPGSVEVAQMVKEGEEFTNQAGESPILVNPNVSPEEQDMDMTPVVVGPGAYASPDPTTNQARLRPLQDHPLVDEISEDYGAAQVVAVETEGQDEAESKVIQAEEAEGDYATQTKAELLEIAQDRGIEGTSSMNKDELVTALEDDDAAQAE